MFLYASKRWLGTMKRPPFVAAVVFGVCLFSATCRRSPEQTGIHADRTLAVSELPSGMVAYQQGKGIFVKSLVTGAQPVRIAERGSCPRFSPDGGSLAFVHSNSIMLAQVDGGGSRTLADAANGKAVAFHPDGSQVLFSDGDNVKSVSIPNGTVRVVAEGYMFQELDISKDGSLLVATVRGLGPTIRIFDLQNGGSRRLSSGCSASFSPDGQFVTCNGGNHTELNLLEQATGRIVRSVPAPDGLKFDNQFWSNHADWLVSVSEGKTMDIYIHYLPSNLCRRVTSGGNCDRPDLFVMKGDRQ